MCPRKWRWRKVSMASAPWVRILRRRSFRSLSFLRIRLRSVLRPTTNRPRRLRPTEWVKPRKLKLRCSLAGPAQWTLLDPGIKQPADLQVLGEEWQLPQWGERRIGVPLHMHTPAEGLDDHRAFGWNQGSAVGFWGLLRRTRWVTRKSVHKHLLVHGFQQLRLDQARVNCSL